MIPEKGDEHAIGRCSKSLIQGCPAGATVKLISRCGGPGETRSSAQGMPNYDH